MADRYWVGGAGTWDATTTHWSASSGGTAGASVPTATDNVIFDTLSNLPTNASYAVTIGTASSCLDISISGPAANTVTITSGATAVINVYGSWFNTATGVAFTSTTGSSLNFLATSTGKTVTTNNIAIGTLSINFNSVSGGWTLGSALNQAGAGINVAAGSFDTGNYAVVSSLIVSNGAIVRSISLGSSTLTLSNTTPISGAVTNLTYNAGTSTINCSNATITFAGLGFTYYNVNFTSATAAINTVAVTGANTFNNLNVTTTTLQKTITLSANQTINGTLTLGATNTAQFRMSVVSDIVGTPRTLTVATLATLTDVDFRDIVAAGASLSQVGLPWANGTRIGNCLGNSNITFTAAATKYWNLPAGGNWTDTAWALTSGGAAAVNNFPLAQDSVVIENTGLNLSASITMNTNADIGPLDMSTRSTAFTLGLGNTDPKFYGNVFLSFALTLTGNTAGSPTFSFYGQGKDSNLAVLGVTLPLQQFIINCPNGSLILQNTTRVELVAATTGVTTLTSGTFNINENSFSTVNFASNSNTTTRTLSLSNGVINITGGNLTAWNTTSSVGLTYTGIPTVRFTYAGSTGTRTISTNAATPISAIILAGSDTLIAATAFFDLFFTGFTGTLALNTRTVSGGFYLNAGMTTTGGALATTFDKADDQYLSMNGAAMDFPVTFSGTGSSTCLDALTLGPVTARALTITGGTLNLAAGTTSTVGSFITTGTTAKFLGSTTPGTQATISDASGTNAVSYLTIKDSNATGGAVWNALAITNVDAGDNTGWLFGTTPSIGNEITMRLRSFTQPRRF